MAGCVARYQCLSLSAAAWKQQKSAEELPPQTAHPCRGLKPLKRQQRWLLRALAERWQAGSAGKVAWQDVALGRRKTYLQRSVKCAAAGAEAGALQDWLADSGLPPQSVQLPEGGATGCVAARGVAAGETLVAVPEHLTVTAADVAAHPVVAQLAQGRGELVGLALWVLYERTLGAESGWWPYLRSLPERTLSPLLWLPEQREALLRGSPARETVRERLAALEEEYAALRPAFEAEPTLFPPQAFSFQAFLAAFAVVLSRVVYLPSAECFALVPLADAVSRSTACRAQLDYDPQERAVCLVADRSYKAGEVVYASYGPEKPNLELFINYGVVDLGHQEDYLETTVGLLNTDRLYTLKKPVLEEAGLQLQQAFPLFRDRFPTQLLSYLRLARLTDPIQMAKVTFEKDVVLDPANEYEVLMLLMSDLRDRLAAYERGVDDEGRLLKSKGLSEEERLAAALRLSEQRILTDTLTALRNRLAPIRGIPTKSGLQDPNADIIEMFDIVEKVASAPAKFLSNVFGGKGN